MTVSTCVSQCVHLHAHKCQKSTSTVFMESLAYNVNAGIQTMVFMLHSQCLNCKTSLQSIPKKLGIFKNKELKNLALFVASSVSGSVLIYIILFDPHTASPLLLLLVLLVETDAQGGRAA